ncbi:MAG TPA: D-sedoheptulose 7-phosphate isomerase [Pyrinomonadaceae bacterium]|jgi:D-sedoheptulose 7-phosphate isomerase|nr:D-sedoheptulose 7-phosphate isomerase [Pyrinomonadaceae bacterium]
MTNRISASVSESLKVKQEFFASHSDDVERAASMIAGSLSSDHKLLIFGNGGSAADAQHIAGELVNRFLQQRRGLPAIALTTDGGVLTCIANDVGFEKVFARQVEALGNEGDVCLAISTSGQSANVIAGCEQARSQGIKVIGLLGCDGGKIAPLCDLALIVPTNDTQRIQETHNLVGHILCELIESAVFPSE